ncbi:hypothetical protein QDQ80_04850 [Providencia rettgeri]|uniref:hypothetical protein n=1 Tax=Providencia rettgeri TaxID=587 RepID=UPI002448AE97|nr:hypothetical protein [Providencia rettgeri]MDH2321623.1 hypothetical protein [Providencia rettgeri]
MTEIEQARFEKIVTIVSNTLNDLTGLFEEFGIDGMHELTNPSIDQLKNLVSQMNSYANAYEKQLLISDDENAITARMLLQNVKQGLLYAESLLIGVEKFNIDACNKAHDDIRNNHLITPTWNNPE